MGGKANNNLRSFKVIFGDTQFLLFMILFSFFKTVVLNEL